MNDSDQAPEHQPGSSARASRAITVFSIIGIAAIIAVVALTSERNGPGSEQNLSVAASTPAPIATVGASLAQTTSAPSVATAPALSDQAEAQLAAAATAAPAAPAATNCIATQTMPGGNNNYRSNAPMVESLGIGLLVSGTVREASTCKPIRNARIQIWLNTARGGEADPSNRGSVMTDENGRYQLTTLPVSPQFGQPHVHIAYDGGEYRSLFLRSVMASKDVPTFTVDFVLEPSDDG